MDDESPDLIIPPGVGDGVLRQRRKTVNCCRRPRITVVKRWVEDGKFQVIQRCRACDRWFRRELVMKLRNGRLQTDMTTENYKEAPPLEAERPTTDGDNER